MLRASYKYLMVRTNANKTSFSQRSNISTLFGPMFYRQKRCNTKPGKKWDIKDKVVVATGAAEGIGYEMARVYLENGCKIAYILDNNTQKGVETEKSFREKYGCDRVKFLHCDVRYDLEDVYCKIFECESHVDVLVNSAGVLNDQKPKRCIDINVTGTILFALKFWHHMRTDKGGKGGTIINLSSIYGFRVDPYLPVYQATKFAIMGFTKVLGHKKNFEKSGVRVVAINPGFTTTFMTEAPQAFEYQKELEAHVKKQSWQKLDAVGRCALEVYRDAPTGTAWLIEGNKPISSV